MNSANNSFRLTKKEMETIKLISAGKMYKEIAGIQNVKLDTIKKHASTAYKKMQVRNRTEALIKLSII